MRSPPPSKLPGLRARLFSEVLGMRQRFETAARMSVATTRRSHGRRKALVARAVWIFRVGHKVVWSFDPVRGSIVIGIAAGREVSLF